MYIAIAESKQHRLPQSLQLQTIHETNVLGHSATQAARGPLDGLGLGSGTLGTHRPGLALAKSSGLVGRATLVGRHGE